VALRLEQPTLARPPRNSALNAALVYVLREVQRDTVWLVPLRVFIGVGWLRAGAEKLVNPAWFDGSALRAFLEVQAPQAVFPVFQNLMRGAFHDVALPLGVFVMVLEVIGGAMIALGWRLRSAIAVAIGLNLLFVMAGVPNPSAFYLVIQMVLVIGGADRVLALRGRRSRRRSTGNWTLWLHLTALSLLVALAVSSLARVRDFSPGGSVHDAAAVLAVVACVGLGYTLISLLRLLQHPQVGSRPNT
jgi:thiosulfate dehydrogenase [quinone] large subunit